MTWFKTEPNFPGWKQWLVVIIQQGSEFRAQQFNVAPCCQRQELGTGPSFVSLPNLCDCWKNKLQMCRQKMTKWKYGICTCLCFAKKVRIWCRSKFQTNTPHQQRCKVCQNTALWRVYTFCKEQLINKNQFQFPFNHNQQQCRRKIRVQIIFTALVQGK